MNNKTLTYVLTGVCVVIFAMFGIASLSMEKIADKAADKVILRLQREYTPGPYAPGFDPDKVNPVRTLNPPKVGQDPRHFK